MAHEIHTNALTGKHEIAFVGEKPWHNLGQELQQGATIEEWIQAAQMDWDVVGSPVKYQTALSTQTYVGQQVLFRSDTFQPLSVVSDEFKGKILIEQHQMLMNLLREELKSRIHAVKLQTYTIEKFNQIKMG